jgi:hypothetical protein
MASKNPLHDKFPSRAYCGGYGTCADDVDKVKCQYSKSSLAPCDKVFLPGAYVNDGYTRATCYFDEEIRVCKKTDPDLGVWNDTRENYKNHPSIATADAVVKCCTASDRITENEKLNCGQMYQGGLGKDRGKRDCHILNSCGDPARVKEPVCNRFAVINKGVPEYQKIALPWWNNWCQKMHATGVGTSELVRYGCFDKNMEADDYEHTRKFYQQYIDSMDGFIPEDPHAKKFCSNQNVRDKGWCDEALERQCTKDTRYIPIPECSCFHYMNDGIPNGPGYKNFKKEEIDYAHLLKKLPADAAGVMAATLHPVCALKTCKESKWKTKNHKETVDCPPCFQQNYKEGRGNATQNNNCIINKIDGKYVIDDSEDPPPEPPRPPIPKKKSPSEPPIPKKKSPPDPPIPKKKNPSDPQQGGSVEPSSAQMTKACGKFRKGPDCKKLSGLSVGLIASSVVLLIFLLMLFLFF